MEAHPAFSPAFLERFSHVKAKTKQKIRNEVESSVDELFDLILVEFLTNKRSNFTLRKIALSTTNFASPDIRDVTMSLLSEEESINETKQKCADPCDGSSIVTSNSSKTKLWEERFYSCENKPVSDKTPSDDAALNDNFVITKHDNSESTKITHDNKWNKAEEPPRNNVIEAETVESTQKVRINLDGAALEVSKKRPIDGNDDDEEQNELPAKRQKANSSQNEDSKGGPNVVDPSCESKVISKQSNSGDLYHKKLDVDFVEVANIDLTASAQGDGPCGINYKSGDSNLSECGEMVDKNQLVDVAPDQLAQIPVVVGEQKNNLNVVCNDDRRKESVDVQSCSKNVGLVGQQVRPPSNQPVAQEPAEVTNVKSNEKEARSGTNLEQRPSHGDCKPAKSYWYNGKNLTGYFKTAFVRCLIPGCSNLIRDTDTLDIHLAQNHRIFPHRCILSGCEASFLENDDLLAHYESQHGNIHLWKCYRCYFRYNNPHQLSAHLEYDHFEGRFECGKDDCPFWSRFRSNVCMHYKRHHLKQQKTKHQQCSVKQKAEEPSESTDWPDWATIQARAPVLFSSVDQDRRTLAGSPLPGKVAEGVEETSLQTQEVLNQTTGDGDKSNKQDTDNKIGNEIKILDKSDPQNAVQIKQEFDEHTDVLVTSPVIPYIPVALASSTSSANNPEQSDASEPSKSIPYVPSALVSQVSLIDTPEHTDAFISAQLKSIKESTKVKCEEQETNTPRATNVNQSSSKTKSPFVTKSPLPMPTPRNLSFDFISPKTSQSATPSSIAHSNLYPSKKCQFRTAFIYCLVAGCEWISGTNEELDDHLFKVHGINKYRCPLVTICEASFSDKSQIYHHQHSQHSEVRHWDCYRCFRSFPSCEGLSRHLWLVHYEGRFECTKPGCTFSAKYRSMVCNHYDSHFDGSHSNSSAASSKSTYYVSEYSWIAPKDNQSMDSEKSATPPVSTTDYDDQRVGIETCTPAEELKCSVESSRQQKKKYSVDYVKCLAENCAEFFLTSNELNAHLSSEHNLLPFLCATPGCAKSYSDRSTLDRHVRFEHGSLLVWYCGKCGQVVKDHGALFNHRSRYHHEGQFSCVIEGCVKVSKYRGDIISHFDRKHLKQKPAK